MTKQINLVINGKGGVGESEIDRIFIAPQTTNMLVIDCRAASTDLFIDFFDEVGLAEVIRTST